MSTRIFNLSANSNPIPGPNFMWARDNEGKCTGRHTFTVLRAALSGATTQNRFRKGTPITTIDTTLPAFFAFLLVDSFESQDLPGGFSEISVTLAGYTETGEFEFDREISYSSDTAMMQRPTTQHPGYLDDVPTGVDRAAMQAMYDGMRYGAVTGIRNEDGEPTSVDFILVNDDEDVVTITDNAVLKWYHLIFERGHRTYEDPQWMWRKSTSNAGGLTQGEISALGKSTTNPPGNAPHPPSPSGSTYKWLKVQASDQRGESSASTEETWQWGDWPDLIYES